MSSRASAGADPGSVRPDLTALVPPGVIAGLDPALHAVAERLGKAFVCRDVSAWIP
ncbi:hypothetical protein J0X15_18805 [Roseibium sp. CAU 1637]|uniref:Uncharacterized protein n=1 Tax=Roseibium limicola TaxID=2816037 RepID=A0A939J8K1_9HYPH|nr:hypothetical protein [Roseibium limicola]MBO0347287.1 hypothetical protein [Roseibium limicola]